MMRIEVEEALKRLDEASSHKPTTRQEHAILQACIDLLEKIVKEWRVMKTVAENPEPPSAN